MVNDMNYNNPMQQCIILIAVLIEVEILWKEEMFSYQGSTDLCSDLQGRRMKSSYPNIYINIAK